jgi:hypothetical protein
LVCAFHTNDAGGARKSDLTRPARFDPMMATSRVHADLGDEAADIERQLWRELGLDALLQMDRYGSPASFWMAWRSFALIGSLWVPSPRAMKELRNECPSTVPRTLTSPRVPKYFAQPGMIT